jgi:hypothetical protein
MKKHGILSQPTQARSDPELTFQDGPCIHVWKASDLRSQLLSPGLPPQPVQEFLKPALHQIVIVLAPGKAGHNAPGRIHGDARGIRLKIVLGHHDDRSDVLHAFAKVGTPIHRIRTPEIGHFAVVLLLDPTSKEIDLLRILGPANARTLESQAGGLDPEVLDQPLSGEVHR